MNQPLPVRELDDEAEGRVVLLRRVVFLPVDKAIGIIRCGCIAAAAFVVHLVYERGLVGA